MMFTLFSVKSLRHEDKTEYQVNFVACLSVFVVAIIYAWLTH